MDVLFVGLGSIGTRHLKNLHAVAAQKGIPVRAWALRSSARALPEETRALLAGEFTSLPEHARYDAAFITNPTHLHFGMLQNLRGKADTLFIEKPIFERTDRALADCLAPGQKAYVAAPMRWCGTMLWPMIALSNIAQGSAVLGMIYLQRKNAAAQEVNVPSCISCYLGVTEPAMFGVNLKYHFPFVCGMIGSAVAAVVCVSTTTTANAIGVGGIPGILSIQPAYMLSFAVCMLIAIVIPFVLTVIVGKKKGIA